MPTAPLEPSRVGAATETDRVINTAYIGGENCCEVGANLREKPEQIHRTTTLVCRWCGTKLTLWVTRAATPRQVNGVGNGRRTKQIDPRDLWKRQKMMCGLGSTLSGGGWTQIGKRPMDPTNGAHRNSDDQAMRSSRLTRPKKRGWRKRRKTAWKKKTETLTEKTRACEGMEHARIVRHKIKRRDVERKVCTRSVWRTTIRKFAYLLDYRSKPVEAGYGTDGNVEPAAAKSPRRRCGQPKLDRKCIPSSVVHDANRLWGGRHSSSNRGTNERTLRSKMAPLATWNWATNTSPSAPGRTPTIRPNRQAEGGVASWMTTMLSIFRFLTAVRHHGRCCIECRYSVDHIFQNADNAAWSSRQRAKRGGTWHFVNRTSHERTPNQKMGRSKSLITTRIGW